MTGRFTTRELAVCAMLAALYTAMCVALAPISYGMIQIRAAEALTLMPVFSSLAIWGVTIGCAMANLIGFMTGANILGFFDIIFGTAATLLAAIFSYKLRNIRFKGLPILSAVPPVIVNALVIGLELMYLTFGEFNLKGFAANAFYVGAGQLVACFVMGLPLVYMLERTGVAEKSFSIR